MEATKEKFDINKMITDQVIGIIEKALETGKDLSWNELWVNSKAMSFSTKKAYRGINTLLLSFHKFTSNYWITWDQVTKIGGKVKEGEQKNYRYAIFWKFLQTSKDKQGNIKTDKNGNPMVSTFPMMRYYRVYNLDQCEGIPENKLPKVDTTPHVHDIHAEAEAIIAGYENGPKVSFGGNSACYIPIMDEVNMPIKEKFFTAEGYYNTFFHELVHSTGHEKRLGRELAGRMNRNSYSKEELIAELGAAILCATCGVKNDIENSAAYLKSWLTHLKNDTKLIVSASQNAQKAVDRILGIKYEKPEETPVADNIEVKD